MHDQHKTINYKYGLYFFALISALCSFTILNRWMIVDIGGLPSFGRVWQFYINYFDFGFVKRGLIGSMLHLLGINAIVDNPYKLAFFIQHVGILALIFLITLHLSRHLRKIGLCLSVAFLFSPALIMQSGYVTGGLDIFVLLLCVILILYVRDIFIAGVLIFFGILIHELFVFCVPAVISCLYIKKIVFEDGVQRSLPRKDMIAFALVFLLISGACVLVYVSGGVCYNEKEYNGMMEQLMPDAAFRHDLWSGYFEINARLKDNVDYVDRVQESVKLSDLVYFLVPLGYIATLFSIVVRNVGQTTARLLIASAAAPLALIFIASDVYRWVGMSTNLLILVILFISTFKSIIASTSFHLNLRIEVL